METAASPYKLHVRVGNAEFRAIGREDAVKDQFDLFMGVLGSIPGAIANGTNGHPKKPASPNRATPTEADLPQGYHDQFQVEEPESEPQPNVNAGPITKDLLDRA